MSLAANVAAAEPADVHEFHTDLWEGVGRVVGRAPTTADLRANGVEALRALGIDGGRPHARDGAYENITAALTVPLLLRRIRDACEGRLMLFKGPEVAARYPHPSLRPFGDLDLLAEDAEAVQHNLIAAGFVPVGDERLYQDIHHLHPLHLDGFPFVVEVHARPKWPAECEPPPTSELLSSSVPSATRVEGLLAPAPAQHVLLLAAHAWAHDPLGRLGSLVDIAALRPEAARDEVEALARRWRIDRLWEVTAASVDALFFGGPTPWPLHTWARHLPRARERTVLETHVAAWLSALCAAPPSVAARAGIAEIWKDVRPAGGEPASTKIRRATMAFRHSFVRRSEHDEDVERHSLDAPHPIFGRDE
jgi:hypothetical protein